jgi:hypothetical protein
MKILGIEEEVSEPVFYIRLTDGTELLSYVVSENFEEDSDILIEDNIEIDEDIEEFAHTHCIIIYPMQIKSRFNKAGTGEESYFTSFLTFTASGTASIPYDYIMILEEADNSIISTYQEMVNDYYLSRFQQADESSPKPKRKLRPKKD